MRSGVSTSLSPGLDDALCGILYVSAALRFPLCRAGRQAVQMGWWNDFWLRTHETAEFARAEPNGAHLALRDIASICPSVRIITQNIDRSCLPSSCSAFCPCDLSVKRRACFVGANLSGRTSPKAYLDDPQMHILHPPSQPHFCICLLGCFMRVAWTMPQ